MILDIGWTSLELRITMTCLNLLYKMSGEQIDQVDVNSYQNFILNLELDGVFVIDIGKTRRKEHLYFAFAIGLWK